MKMIHNIKQLAAQVGVPDCFVGDYWKAVERAVYKGTSCGCTFSHDDHGIEVAGYAEGADAECPTHRLDYPFSVEAFWCTLEQADEEGCEMWHEWNDSHAMECPRCKEIALEHDRSEGTLAVFECAACGHIEVHNESLPSWYS
jgi:hypothetical protein